MCPGPGPLETRGKRCNNSESLLPKPKTSKNADSFARLYAPRGLSPLPSPNCLSLCVVTRGTAFRQQRHWGSELLSLSRPLVDDPTERQGQKNPLSLLTISKTGAPVHHGQRLMPGLGARYWAASCYIGRGIDITVNEHIATRPAPFEPFEYLLTRFGKSITRGNNKQSNSRYSASV